MLRLITHIYVEERDCVTKETKKSCETIKTVNR